MCVCVCVILLVEVSGFYFETLRIVISEKQGCKIAYTQFILIINTEDLKAYIETICLLRTS